jgi:hypothetical protein
MKSFLPEGLSQGEVRELDECVARAEALTLDVLLARAREHVAETRAAYEINPLLDLGLAEALLKAIEALIGDWPAVPAFARGWCKGMVLYFASCNKDEDDHESPIGFDDDAEVINSCLRRAGRDDLCVDPEECEGAV